MQVPNKMLYGCTDPMFSVDLSDTNLALNPVPVTNIGGDAQAQCAFNADFTVLYGVSGGEMVTIDTQGGGKTLTGWEIGNYIDLGGSSFFGTEGSSGSCHTSLKTRTPKTAKRGRFLRYRAYVRNGNKTVASINNVRVEVTLPPEVSIVSSHTSLKRKGVVGSPSNGVMEWGVFNLTGHKNARFSFKAQISTIAMKGQVLTLNTTVYEDGAACPQQMNTVGFMATCVFDFDKCVCVCVCVCVC